MSSLFNQQYSNQIIERLHKLSPQSKALWGKMNVSQMLAHCQVPLQLATGEMKLKGNPIIRFLFGSIAKKKLLQGQPFKQSLPTFKEAVITTDKNFDAEKEKLISLLKTFAHKGEAGITKEAHPFFGELKPHEWDALQAKHLDHHLRQFGV